VAFGQQSTVSSKRLPTAKHTPLQPGEFVAATPTKTVDQTLRRIWELAYWRIAAVARCESQFIAERLSVKSLEWRDRPSPLPSKGRGIEGEG